MNKFYTSPFFVGTNEYEYAPHTLFSEKLLFFQHFERGGTRICIFVYLYIYL